MNITPELIEKSMKKMREGVTYPPSLLARHDLNNAFDAENLKYLTGGGAAGAYFQWLSVITEMSDAQTIVELGNRYGTSTLAIYGHLKANQTLITIDTERDQRYIPAEVFKDKRVKFIYGDCLDLKSYGAGGEEIPFNIDILWTDTVHYFEQLSSEFEVYEPLLADEALIVIDDIRLNDKGRFFDESKYKKFDLTEACHGSGFGAIHYVRAKDERGRSPGERKLEAALRASAIWKRRAEQFSSESHFMNTLSAKTFFVKKIKNWTQKHLQK